MPGDDSDAAAQGDRRPGRGEVPGRADERMPGERQLRRRREDPHGGGAVGADGVDEDRLGEPEFGGDQLHRAVGEQSVVNAEVVAAAAVAGEDADNPNGDGVRRVVHGRRP